MTNDLTSAAAAPYAEAAPVADQVGVAVPLPVGRRERQHGNLRTLADVHIAAVYESADDLAVADRVAYVIARRTGTSCMVVATPRSFLIAASDTELSLADVATLQPAGQHHRIVTIATPEGIAPLLDRG